MEPVTRQPRRRLPHKRLITCSLAGNYRSDGHQYAAKKRRCGNGDGVTSAVWTPGQTIDVVVSSMGNAKSLRGGTLLMTPLKGVDSQVYALAQGNILVGGAGASAGGSSVQVNQLNGGRITNGAVIERELPSQFGVGNTLNLQLNDEDFSMAQQIADTINRVRGYGSATALDARTIQVRVPSGNSSQVRFLPISRICRLMSPRRTLK